ncbi:MAG: fused response regulator/phosphatase [Nitrospiraceae bacterium]|nr:fused response regulator/phosphatase [Nitrospiraceae bacterium]
MRARKTSLETASVSSAGKILVVDDSEDARELLGSILQRAGYDVFFAADGTKSLSAVSLVKPDLVLLDVTMPDLDGYEVCRVMKSHRQLADIPVVFLTACSESRDKVKGLEIGGADYIVKPFDKAEVIARVRNQLKIRSLTAELVRMNLDLAEKQRNIEAELKSASGIQKSLLPVAGVGTYAENLEMAWRFLPSQYVGGDIFNVLGLCKDHIGVYMLDVSGHGMPAALLTLSVAQALDPHSGFSVKKETPASSRGETVQLPHDVLALLDGAYPISRFDRYFTMVYLIMDTAKGVIRYSNAGHWPPVLLSRKNSFKLLEKGGPPIGVGAAADFEEEELPLQDKDTLVLYTDGLIEQCNSEGETFGEPRFYGLLQANRNKSVSGLLDTVMEELKKFTSGTEIQDDISLLGLQYSEKRG